MYKMKLGFLFCLVLCVHLSLGLNIEPVSERDSINDRRYEDSTELYATEKELDATQLNSTACRCLNGSCVKEGDSEYCLCPKGFGKWQKDECKECNCGKGFSCIFLPLYWRKIETCICGHGSQIINNVCIEDPTGNIDASRPTLASLTTYMTDPCTHTTNPCKNGGTCLDEWNTFSCICKPPFFGRYCDYEDTEQNRTISDRTGTSAVIPGPCARVTNPCMNGGTCINEWNTYRCICRRPFFGRYCHNAYTEEDTTVTTRPDITTIAPGPCSRVTNPCMNGGTCINEWNTYRCMCKRPFFGRYCHQAYTEEATTVTARPGITNITPGPCTTKPCMNGGTCIDRWNTYWCVCEQPFFGKYCQYEHAYTEEGTTMTARPSIGTETSRLCTRNPCLNGGRCIEERNTFICICKQPFLGRHCDYVGISTNLPWHSTDDFDMRATQSSSTAYSTIVSTTIIPSTLPAECECGGKSLGCHYDTSGNKICTCFPGYAQIEELCSDCYCGENAIDCSFERGGDKICFCKPGYSQRNKTCSATCRGDGDCMNGGLCKMDSSGQSFCDCTPSFKGERCETSILCDKLSDRCKAIRAECRVVGATAVCECSPDKAFRWESGRCESICDSRKCMHGRCEIMGSTYRCRCDQGYTGPNCNQVIRTTPVYTTWYPYGSTPYYRIYR